MNVDRTDEILIILMTVKVFEKGKEKPFYKIFCITGRSLYHSHLLGKLFIDQKTE